LSYNSQGAPESTRAFRDAIQRTPRWLLIAGTLALVFYCVNAFHYGKTPLRIEESEWPPMAKAVFETGEPIVAADEMHRLRYDEDLTVDQSPVIGAWHPPLYIYTIGASMVVFGTDSPHMLRAVGAAGLLLAALLLLLIAREVTPRWRVVGGVAVILLLIHPYAIQGSMFLDIDNSVYTPPALLTIWLAIRYGKREGPLTNAQIVMISASIALVTWTKMTTTVVLLAVLAMWWVLTRRPFRQAVIECIAFIAVGATIFLSTYATWCLVTDIPFSYTFEVTFFGKSNRLLSEWWLVNNAAHWHLRWLGIGLLLLAAVYLVDLVRHFATNRQLRALDLPFLIGGAILVQYVVLSPTDGTYQGKYAFPALVMMLLPISWLLLRNERDRVQSALWALAIALGAVAVLLLPDLLTGLSVNGNYGSWAFEVRTALIAGAALLLAWLLAGRGGFANGVIVILAALFVAQAVRSYRADTSPLYPVADTADFTAAVHDLNQSTSKKGIVVVPKDIGFYVRRRIIEGEDAFARGDARLAATIRRYPQIEAYAHDSFGPPIGPATEAVLKRCFLDQRTYGTATIVYRTTNCG
jgi:hypothetical protein